MAIVRSEIAPFLLAIETSENFSEFFSKVAVALTKYCKKIHIIWQEPDNQKVNKIERIGRNKFKEIELENLEIKEEPGYRIIHLETSEEIKSKGGRFSLKIKTKSYLPSKKFSAVIDIISTGIDIIYRKQKDHRKIETEEEEKKESLRRLEILKKLCFIKQQEIEKIAKSIIGIIKELLPSSENISISIPQKANVTLKENREFSEEIEKIWEALSSNAEPIKKSDTHYFRIKSEDPSSPAGIIVIKAQSIGKNERKIIEMLAEYLEMHIQENRKREESEIEKMFELLFKDIEIPIAVFKKNSDLPIFKNGKFEECLQQYPKLQNIVKEDVAFSVNFAISSMREVNIEEKTFVLFSNILKETYTLIQIAEVPKPLRYPEELRRTNYPDISLVESKMEEIKDSIEDIAKKTPKRKIKEELNSIINAIRNVQNEIKLASIKREEPKKIDVAELITKVLASIKTPSKMKIRINKKGDTISEIEEELSKIILTDIFIKTMENKENSTTKLTINVIGEKENVVIQLYNTFSEKFISSIIENFSKYSPSPIKVSPEGNKIIIKFPKSSL